MLSPSTAVNDVDQSLSPTLYCTVAPASTPVTEIVPTEVLPSDVLIPTSEASATLTGDTAVSSVNVIAATPDRLPAVSVCLTRTVLTPGTAVNDDAHVMPSVEYSTAAPSSTPARFKSPEFVRRSVLLVPPSVCSDGTGVATVVSSVKESEVTAEGTPLDPICRTWTLFSPGTATNEVCHVLPPSVEYCTVMPSSRPVTDRPPLFVIPSELLAPVSLARATLSAGGGVTA